MRYLLTFCAFYFFIDLQAQTECPFKMALDTLRWEGDKSITLKLIAQPKPKIGQFKIFRKCPSEDKNKKKEVGYFDTTKNEYEYPDTDPALKSQYIYVYRVEYTLDKRCWTVRATIGRPIEDDDD